MLQRSLFRFRWKSLIAPWQQVDWILLLLVTGLAAFGGLMIHSTEVSKGLERGLQHWIIGGVGVIIALTISRWRYEFLIQARWYIYALTNIILLAVIFLGKTTNGAQSWISLGGFQFQPSEFAKLGVILTLAATLHSKPPSKLSAVLKALAITALPWILIMLQPDLGTGLVFAAITLGMLYWGNANPGWLILMLSPLVAAILFNVYFSGWVFWVIAMTVIAWFTLPWKKIAAVLALAVNLAAGELGGVLWNSLKPYQQDRLTLFFQPEKDPLGGGYHLIQSRIAIGSGEMWGRGLYHGTQTQLNFIPEQHTDFIFSVVGEEFGFIGSFCLLLVFWLICWRLIFIASNSKENFGSLIAVGVLSMVAFQTIVNISMTIGLAPITGIPLPWLSYGGSSLITNFIALGLVEAVANFRRKKSTFS